MLAVAAFDFDGTLTVRDTMLPFIQWAVGMRCFRAKLPLAVPAMLTWRLGSRDNRVLKERLFQVYFRGLAAEALAASGRDFAANGLTVFIRPESLARFCWHRQQGHRCIVVTASPDIYVRPWALAAGFDDVLASRLEVDAYGRITGRHQDEHCDGPEKIRRVRELLRHNAPYTLYAYGDSRGDRELLAAANHAYYRVMPAMEKE